MKRLLATVHCDIRLQFRNGFYYAAAFVVAYLSLLLLWPRRSDLAWILPACIFGNLMMNTFYFLSGLLLLEKREGTLEAQVVTPLRTGEYLGSKLVTLTGLSLAENLFIILIAYGADFRAFPLLLGMVLACAIYCLAGFAVAARYDSINEFLMPSMLFTVLFSIPLLPYFGYLEGWWHYLHPLMGPLLLMEAGFQTVPLWKQVYGALYPLAWLAPIFVWSRSAFYRFVIAREGRR